MTGDPVRPQRDLFDDAVSGAVISACERYRYRLWRHWDRARPYCNFVMLNPSTADGTEDDPTIRRCIALAQRWGYGGLEVCNLFAYRATRPAVLRAVDDPVGPDNDATITKIARGAEMVVCAWGNQGAYRDRSRTVLWMFFQSAIRAHYLRLNRSGEPRHPLYLEGALTPIPLYILGSLTPMPWAAIIGPEVVDDIV